MTPQEDLGILDLFRATGAYLSGHFRLTSGLHSPEYLQCALVLQHPRHAEHLGRLLAGRLLELSGAPLDAVASPALGGVVIGHEVARALGVRFIFTERDAQGKMTLRRGFQVTGGERIVVVEDVWNYATPTSWGGADGSLPSHTILRVGLLCDHRGMLIQ